MIVNRSASIGDNVFSLFSLLCLLSLLSLYHVLTLFFCDNSDDEHEENLDIRPGDDGDDDRMSIASSTMQSVASGMSKDQLEAIVVTMFNKMMQENANAIIPTPVTKTPKKRTTAAGATDDEPPAPSPQKAAFLREHELVAEATDAMCQAIQKLNQKELWWVQQWVYEAKLKYNTKTIRTYTDNVHRYNIKQAAQMRVKSNTQA